MTIGEHEIRTPYDNKTGYDLDWRARIVEAVAASNMKMPKAHKNDLAMNALLACLKGARKQDPGCRGAMAIRSSPTMSRVVEAYLLTRASTSQISSDTGFSNGGIALYEQLYFNVRNRYGDPLQPQLIRLAFELESTAEPATPAEKLERMLRKAALDGDIQLLRRCIPHRRAAISTGSFAATLVQRELTRRLLRGELSTGSLIKLRELEIAEDRMNLSLNKSGEPDLHNDNGYYAGDPSVLESRTF